MFDAIGRDGARLPESPGWCPSRALLHATAGVPRLQGCLLLRTGGSELRSMVALIGCLVLAWRVQCSTGARILCWTGDRNLYMVGLIEWLVRGWRNAGRHLDHGRLHHLFRSRSHDLTLSRSLSMDSANTLSCIAMHG